MMSVGPIWDRVFRNLQHGATAALARADEVSRLGRVRLDIAVLKNRIGRAQAELGAEVYRSIRSGVSTDLSASPEVQLLCDRIHGLEEELASWQLHLSELHVQLRAERKKTGEETGVGSAG